MSESDIDTDKISFEVEIKDINIEPVIKKAYKEFKNKNISKSGYSYKDETIKDISFSLLKDEINIHFSLLEADYKILKYPLYFIQEKSKEQRILVFTKSDLESSLNAFSNDNEFIVHSVIKKKDEILQNIPKEIYLRKKVHEIISYKDFILLNKKQESSKEDSILINTNELIPRNINSLGIFRDNKIFFMIKKRNELIEEIKDFMNHEVEKVMKIYGVDGIGKSLTFIYLTSLKNNFKIIYFNLKEFFDKNRTEIINIFKSQLVNYYTNKYEDDKISGNNINLPNLKDKQYKTKFNYLQKLFKGIDEKINNKDEIDFWILLDITLDILKTKYGNKALIILDQYKIENDSNNQLKIVEKEICNNLSLKNIKLLVVSSLNDMRVKNDFIQILKECSKFGLNNKIQIFEDKNENEIMSIDESKDIFEDFSPDNDYLEKEELKDNDFGKIKKFNNIDDKEEIKNENNEDKDIKDENYLIDKIENYFSKNDNNDENTFINDKYRIIYINDLVSIENNDKEEKNILKKLKEFNFNPKCYNEFKKCFNDPMKNKDLDKAYHTFINNKFAKIKLKINRFYDDFNKKFATNLSDRDIALNLIQLDKLVEEKKELNLKSLIHYLIKFPLKYIKIYKVNHENENKGFLRLNKDLSKFLFRIEYAFPFIKFVIGRILYDFGEKRKLKYTDFSPSGFGNLLEIEIRKAIIIKKIFKDFISRSVWSLENTKRKKLEKNKDEYNTKIDFFNLKELTFDDEIDNPLENYDSNYYIVPNKINNPLLDSIILLPCGITENSKKVFNMISFQITINKKNIKKLKDYHKASNSAAELFERIYNIKIKEKYFTFVLAKGYDNQKTQEDLVIMKIPYVFFSSLENSFYFDNLEKIDYVEQFLNDRFKISDPNNQTIFSKNIIFREMEILLNRKRKRDKITITKNLFSFIRKKLFRNEKPLILSKQKKNEIIQAIKNSQFYKNKNITIEYIFRVNFSRIKNFHLCDNSLVGIIFYKQKTFIINNKLDVELIMTTKNQNDKIDEITSNLYKLFFSNKLKESDDVITHPNLESLLTEKSNKPSNIFVFSIYELNK